MAKKAIIHIPPTYCDICEKESIDIYNIYNKPIGYPSLIRNFNIHEVLALLKEEKYPLAYMKCPICNRIYIIDWTNGLPKPLKDNNIITNRFGRKRK